MSAPRYAADLRWAEERLRAVGMTGRAAYAALCRHLARRLGIPEELWLPGPDAPAEAGLDRMALTAELDIFGLAYERFFPDVFKAERGQYFTPRPLVELMADLGGVRPGDRVLDPACGSGAFLVAAWQRGADVDGIEVDPELVALARIHLRLHGANPRAVRRGDVFREELEGGWDVVLANPPFSVPIEHPDALRRFALARGRARAPSDELFVEAAWRALRPGGRLVVVLPYSVLSNPAYAALRDWIDERFVREAIVSLPEGVFRPFGGASARACVLALRRRPAVLRPWVAAVVRNPGYDPRRRTYHPSEPDEIAALRIALAEGRAPRAPEGSREWRPERLHGGMGPAAGVPTVRLGDLAPVRRDTFAPGDEPEARFTEVDVADVDRHTGEVSGARVRRGAEFRGRKAAIEEGDLLFARIRPNLNKVAVATRPRPGLPRRMAGSAEWVRLRPPRHRYFVLVAARSSFARGALAATAGQTRPRVTAAEIAAVEVPDPGERARALVDRIVGRAHRRRLRERMRIEAVAALYERFGRGEIDAAAFEAALDALEAEE